MVLLNTLTASSSSTLDDTSSLTSAYSSYAICLQNLVPTTNGTFLGFRIQSASSFQTTGYLTTALSFVAATSTSNSLTTSIGLSNPAATDIANTAASGLSGWIFLNGPVSTSANTKPVTIHTSYLNSSGTATGVMSTGFWNSTGAITGIRIFPNTSTIASGTVKIYGIV